MATLTLVRSTPPDNTSTQRAPELKGPSQSMTEAYREVDSWALFRLLVDKSLKENLPITPPSQDYGRTSGTSPTSLVTCVLMTVVKLVRGLGAMADHDTDPLQPTMQRLAQLAKLSPNWNSYGAVAPTPDAMAVAYSLVISVAEQVKGRRFNGIRPAAVAPLVDGGVRLDWRAPKVEIDVEIEPTGDMGFLLVDRRGSQCIVLEKDSASWQQVLEAVATTVESSYQEQRPASFLQSDRWHVMEREADADFASGRTKVFDDVDSFLADLDA